MCKRWSLIRLDADENGTGVLRTFWQPVSDYKLDQSVTLTVWGTRAQLVRFDTSLGRLFVFVKPDSVHNMIFEDVRSKSSRNKKHFQCFGEIYACQGVKVWRRHNKMLIRARFSPNPVSFHISTYPFHSLIGHIFSCCGLSHTDTLKMLPKNPRLTQSVSIISLEYCRTAAVIINSALCAPQGLFARLKKLTAKSSHINTIHFHTSDMCIFKAVNKIKRRVHTWAENQSHDAIVLQTYYHCTILPYMF